MIKLLNREWSNSGIGKWENQNLVILEILKFGSDAKTAIRILNGYIKYLKNRKNSE